MDGLRWLLLLFGLLIVVGVYLYSRRERANPEESIEESDAQAPAIRMEPSLGADVSFDDRQGARRHNR